MNYDDDRQSFYIEYIVSPTKGLVKIKHLRPSGGQLIADILNISCLVRLTFNSGAIGYKLLKTSGVTQTKIRLLCWQYIESSRSTPFSGHIRRATAFKKMD